MDGIILSTGVYQHDVAETLEWFEVDSSSIELNGIFRIIIIMVISVFFNLRPLQLDSLFPLSCAVSMRAGGTLNMIHYCDYINFY